MIDVPAYIRALIFDCDGTLVDTMPLHMRAWEHVLKGVNSVWDYDFFFSKKGMPEAYIVELYNEKYGTSLDPDAIAHAKHVYFRSHSSEFKPIEPVVEVAKKYHGRLLMAIASGGTRENIDLQLDAIGIKEYFPVILTADDGFPPKPAPDMFLECARRMNVEPSSCLVFEDGDYGLDGAKKAGMAIEDMRNYFL